MSTWSLTNYQTHPGIIGTALPHVHANAHALAARAGLPGVRMLAQDAYSVGLHKRGQDIDFQAGRGNDDAHEALASLVLAHWHELGTRYMAWDGFEWLDSPKGPRRRRQTKNYGGSDPFHANHVHVSWHPTGEPVKWQDITPGESAPAPEPDPDPIGNLMSTIRAAVVLFEHKASIYRADMLAGTYYRIPNPATLTDTTAMLDRQHIPWAWHKSSSGGRIVGNPSAYGVEVTPR